MISSRVSTTISSSICKSNAITSCSGNGLNVLMQRLDLTSSPSSCLTNNTADGSCGIATTIQCSAMSTMSNIKSSQDGQREVVKFIGLNNLSDNPGAVKKARRVGRGIGSSKGKTCGKGHKGQKARNGKGPSPLFEGGQTPFYKRIPKRGFTNKHAQPMVPINIGTLQDYIDMGRLVVTDKNKAQPFTMKDLVDAGITKNSAIKHGIKLLAKGKERLRTPFHIEISRASAGAIEAIEKIGGEITTVHYNKLAIRALLKPEKFEVIPKRARPPPKLIEYYTDFDKRGYLSAEKQLEMVHQRLGLDAIDHDNGEEEENTKSVDQVQDDLDKDQNKKD